MLNALTIIKAVRDWNRLPLSFLLFKKQKKLQLVKKNKSKGVLSKPFLLNEKNGITNVS